LLPWSGFRLGFQGAAGGLSCLRFAMVEALSPQGFGACGFGFTAWPNKSVKGTRRPVAVLKFSFIKVRRLRLASVSGAPLTNTLGGSF